MEFRKKNNISTRNRRFPLVIIITLTFISTVLGQKDKANYVEITGVIEDFDYKPIAGATVKLYENNNQIKSTTTKSSGEFQFFVDYNSYYIVEVSKPGMVTKKIAYDTQLPEGSEGVWGVGFPISLFEGCPGVNTSAMDKPIGLIKYNERKRELEGDEDYRRNMQAKMSQLMTDIEDCKRQAYKETIKEADAEYKQKNYEQAKENYEEALKQNPSDPYATKKLEEINQILAKTEQTKKLYDVNIDEGDKYFDAGNLPLAKSFYQRSLTYDKNAEYPQQKIAEIERLLAQKENESTQNTQQAQQAAKKEAYNKLVAQADKLYNSGDYNGAKNLYNQAQALQPNNPYPKSKITDIETNQKKKEEEEANQRAIDYAYKNAILDGDSKFNYKQYMEAKEAYQKALTYKPGADYPKTKIAEIEQILSQQRYQQAQEDAKDQQYRNAIAEADKYMQEQNYQAAKNAYQKASSIKPDESYPRTKIAEADKQISEYQRKAAEDQAKEQAYRNAIAEGDQYMQAQNYPAARAAYQKAQTFKPNDSYSKSKIDEVDRAIASRQIQQQQQEQAREQSYKNYVTEGDKFMTAGNYAAAKAAYQKALGLKPNESYPRNRISEADKQIAEQQRQTAQDQAKEQAYNNAITEADQYFRDQNYPAAKAAYQKALTFKPSESYPRTKIAEIDRAISEKQQLLAQQQAKEQAYKDAIVEGDQYYNTKNYSAAKTSYLKALNIKPNENYPHTKITEIDKIVAQQQQQQAQQQAKEQAYKTAIAEADQYFKIQNYTAAKAAYQKALTYKPNESYPKTKISEIDRLVAQQAQQQAQQQAKEQAFKSALAEADQYFSAKNYLAAKAAYQKALTFKPDENYPKTRIAEIDRLVAQQQQQIAQQQAKEKQYNDAIAEADRYFQSNNYSSAKSSYQKALNIEPGSSYPTNKIKEIDNLLVQQEADKEYQNTIDLADNYLKQNDLQAAKSEYEKASRLKPAENYPKTKIQEINNRLAQDAKTAQEEKQKKAEFNRLVNLADTYFSKKDYKNAKDSYNKALAIYPNAPHPSQRISEIDRLLKQQATAPPVKKKGEIADISFKTKDDEARYLAELIKKYPVGVTLETYKSDRRTVRRYIVIRNGVANEFRQVQYSWGSEYSHNGRDITNQFFKQQTEVKPGENYEAFDME